MRLLLTLDGSSLAEAALRPARTLAASAPGTEVVVLSVLDPGELGWLAKVPPAGGGAAPKDEPPAEAVERLRREVRAYLEDVAEGLRDVAATVRVVVAVGRPAAEILRVAREEAVDFLVMATHGRSGLSELLQGSVAEAVVRVGIAPVVLVRPAQP